MKYNNIKSYNSFTEFLIQKLEENGLFDIDLRNALQLDPRTWKKRKQEPKDFTLDQVNQLATLLKTDPATLQKEAMNVTAIDNNKDN